MQAELMNALVLAYIGDAWLEVLVREYLVLKKQIAKPNELQKAATHYVSAKAQAAFIKNCKQNEFFTEEEWQWYRRGRNTKGRKNVKNMDVLTHNESSGFEAVIGTLHLKHQDDRIAEIFEAYCQFVEAEKEGL